jgi:ribosomal protein S18 acetylase RimI-like enzyme
MTARSEPSVPTLRAGGRVTDRPAVEAITRSSGYFSDEEVAIALEVFDDSLTKPEMEYHFIFAEIGATVAGYVCYGPIEQTESSFDLYWVAVDASIRNAGIGSLLMAGAERAAASMGCERMYVETAGRVQYAPTRAFYERIGYQRAAVLEDFYAAGDAKVIYAKKLAPPP